MDFSSSSEAAGIASFSGLAGRTPSAVRSVPFSPAFPGASGFACFLHCSGVLSGGCAVRPGFPEGKGFPVLSGYLCFLLRFSKGTQGRKLAGHALMGCQKNQKNQNDYYGFGKFLHTA